LGLSIIASLRSDDARHRLHGDPLVPRLLILDDDRAAIQCLRQAFKATGVRVSSAQGGKRARSKTGQAPDVVIVAVGPERGAGWSQLETWVARGVAVMIVLSSPDGASAISAMRRGAAAFFFKPLDYAQVRDTVLLSLQRRRAPAAETMAAEEPAPQRVAVGQDRLIGRSAAMRRLYKQLAQAALAPTAVLFVGETGTGKDLAAFSLHRHSSRSAERCERIDVAGIAGERLESDLFGEEPALSAGSQRPIGVVERCDGGSLVLSEVDRLPMRAQARMLNMIEHRQLTPVGGTPASPLDVRILASTRAELEPLVRSGGFRPELLYHLREFVVALPPLRDRTDDLPELVDYFLARLSGELGQLPPPVSPDALERLGRHAWPGNLWELQSVLRQALWRSDGRLVTPESLPDEVSPRPTATTTAAMAAATAAAAWPRLTELDVLIRQALEAGGPTLYADSVAFFDRFICQRVLDHTEGNQSRAARLLGITRRSLRTKIKKWSPANAARSASGKRKPRGKTAARKEKRVISRDDGRSESPK
jgi:DNA-binding NtrC family response regulator